MTDINGNGRMEALKRKEAALQEAVKKQKASIRAAIEREQAAQRERDAKNRSRLIEIVGNALIEQAEKSPDFLLMLKQILGSAVTDGPARRFLEEKGFV